VRLRRKLTAGVARGQGAGASSLGHAGLLESRHGRLESWLYAG